MKYMRGLVCTVTFLIAVAIIIIPYFVVIAFHGIMLNKLAIRFVNQRTAHQINALWEDLNEGIKTGEIGSRVDSINEHWKK